MRLPADSAQRIQAAVERAEERTSAELVVVAFALKFIMAVTAKEHVVSAATLQRIITAGPDHEVVSTVSLQRVWTAATCQRVSTVISAGIGRHAGQVSKQVVARRTGEDNQIHIGQGEVLALGTRSGRQHRTQHAGRRRGHLGRVRSDGADNIHGAARGIERNAQQGAVFERLELMGE